MCKTGDKLAHTSSRFRANVFWMGKAPLVKNKKYKLKLATLRAPVRLVEIVNVLDASDLSSERGKQQVERHEVADCIFEATKPIVFDLTADIEGTGRFVLVDNYEIAGGGIITGDAAASSSILQEHIRQREAGWEHSAIPDAVRASRYGHRSKFVVVTGASEAANKAIAQALERRLFDQSCVAYYLGIANIDRGLDSDVLDAFDQREERVRRLGEVARILTDSGQIFITTITDVDVHDIERLKALNAPNEILVIVVGSADYQDVHAQVQIPEAEDLPVGHRARVPISSGAGDHHRLLHLTLRKQAANNRDFSASTHGVADVNRIRRYQVLQLQRSFCCRLGFEQMPAVNSRQQSASHRRREPAAIFFNEHVADGALGHLAAFIEEQHLVVAMPARLRVLLIVQLAAGGFVPQETVAGKDSAV